MLPLCRDLSSRPQGQPGEVTWTSLTWGRGVGAAPTRKSVLRVDRGVIPDQVLPLPHPPAPHVLSFEALNAGKQLVRPPRPPVCFLQGSNGNGVSSNKLFS